MGRNSVEVENVPDPKIQNDRDAIVRITSTAICGSDLHLVDGYVPTMRRGDVLGHEFMGEVVEKGKGVTNLEVGEILFSDASKRRGPHPAQPDPLPPEL